MNLTTNWIVSPKPSKTSEPRLITLLIIFIDHLPQIQLYIAWDRKRNDKFTNLILIRVINHQKLNNEGEID